ncbi:MAG: hypothetical protein F6J90_23470 [Moorea sp. SIOASIH]|uniref:hypothetical protein n=1 Tax=Moorena sp. SIOASIH TaxID=2607817 RepID=UPI0013BBB1D7|nr:hypothetical protein [Moorena sp. SIOASIH]NEO39133.1 hypothetical protein [Moorena sp. SIOASIH]
MSSGRKMKPWAKEDTALVMEEFHESLDQYRTGDDFEELPIGYKPWIYQWIKEDWDGIQELVKQMPEKAIWRDKEEEEEEEGKAGVAHHVYQFGHSSWDYNFRDGSLKYRDEAQEKILIFPPLLERFDNFCKDIAIAQVELDSLEKSLYSYVSFPLNDGADTSFAEWINSKDCTYRSEFTYEEDEDYYYWHKCHFTFDLQEQKVYADNYQAKRYEEWVKAKTHIREEVTPPKVRVTSTPDPNREKAKAYVQEMGEDNLDWELFVYD